MKKIRITKLKIKNYIVLLLLVAIQQLDASFNINHVFHLPIKTKDFFQNKKTASGLGFFFSHAKKGYDYNDKKTSILNIEGEYNLKTITKALDILHSDLGEPGYINPIKNLNPLYDGRNGIYDVNSVVRTCGITLAHEQRLYQNLLFCGFSLPILYLNTLNKVTFSTKKSDSYLVNVYNTDPAAWHEIETRRRDIHQELGLKGNLWSKTSIGDCEFHLGLHKNWEHVLFCKEIQLSFRLGAVAPTGIQYEDDYISSVACGNNGHWSIYSALGFDINIKQNLHIGMLSSLVFPFARIRPQQRISIYEEPSYMSPLKKDLYIKPGMLWSLSPYITFENLLQGAHLHVKYTYLHHNKNKIKEVNTDGQIESYLTRTSGPGVTTDGILQIKRLKKNGKWYDHYMTFEAMYNPAEALKKWWYDPHFYAVYNYPIGGRGAAQNHHIGLGIVLHF